MAAMPLIGATSARAAADPASREKVRFSDVGWTDITATTASASLVLEALGYKPKTQFLSVPVTYAAMKNKDIDVFLGNWMPSIAGDSDPFTKDGSIMTGEICVLMGLSGSGKSSLPRCVNGLNSVTRGRVLVEDNGSVIDVAKCEASVLGRLRMNRISMVFQQFTLMPWRTIRENVGLGLELPGLGAAERGRLVDGKLALVRLDQRAGEAI